MEPLRENEKFPTVRVVSAVREAIFWITDRLPWPRYDELGQIARQGRQPGAAILYRLEMVESRTSQTANYAFLIAPPLWLVLALGRWIRKPVWAAACAVALWLVCLAFFAAHALIHIEFRYMAPVLPFVLALGAAAAQDLIDLFGAIWRRIVAGRQVATH